MKCVLVVIILAIALQMGCTSDRDKIVEPPAQNQFRALAQRDDVLFNLELAYNVRNIDQYAQLLDNNFIFHFSSADVDSGNVQVAQWGRADELQATRNMFNVGTLPAGVDPISDISLQLVFNDGGDDWQEVTPPDQQQYPGEIWYVQIIDYILSVQAGYLTLTSGGPLKAEFTIRQTDDTGATIWRIVAWRDIGEK